MDKIMGNLIALDLIFSIIIMAIGMIFTRQILSLSGAEGEILDIATRYLRIIFAGSLFVNFAQSANMIMRGEGVLKRAMMISGGAAVLNIILDPIFITILNPIGQGAEGAAYATIISQFMQAAFTLPIMIAPKTMLSLFIVEPEIVAQGANDFRLFFSSCIVLGFWVIILTLMQSLGRASKASVLVLLRQIIIYIPLIIFMPYVAGLGVHGLFFAPLITDAVVLIVVIWMMCSEFKKMDQLKAANV